MATQRISLIPPSVNLAFYGGDGAAVRLTITDANGAPYPLDGGELKAQVRSARADTIARATFIIDNTEAPSGIITIGLSSEQTASLVGTSESYSGVWDMQWTASGAEPVTLIQGKIGVTHDVTS